MISRAAVEGFHVTADDDTDILANAGSITLAAAGSIGGSAVVGTFGASIAVNEIENAVRSRISGSTVNVSGSVDLSAASESSIWALTVSGTAAGSGAGVWALAGSGAGSGSYNRVKNSIEAYIEDSPRIGTTDNEISLSTKDGSKILANAGAVSIAVAAGGAGVIFGGITGGGSGQRHRRHYRRGRR